MKTAEKLITKASGKQVHTEFEVLIIIDFVYHRIKLLLVLGVNRLVDSTKNAEQLPERIKKDQGLSMTVAKLAYIFNKKIR